MPLSTNKGAVTRLRRSSDERFCWKKSLIFLIPISVWDKLSKALYPAGLIR